MQNPKRTRCGQPSCTGKHGMSGAVALLCPAALDKKRAYQRAWFRAKYAANREWRYQKQASSCRYYHKTGWLRRIQARIAAKQVRLGSLGIQSGRIEPGVSLIQAYGARER